LSLAPVSQEVLGPAEWRARRAAHEARADRLVEARRARARKGVRDPVEDFLFTYYPFRLAALRRWTPGAGVALAEADELVDGHRFLRGSDGLVRVALPDAAQAGRLAFSLRLCRAVAARAAFFGCFGLHEWAMVYRQTPAETRHNAWPLRFSPEETARVVESAAVTCSHFDAFRFFTAPARPLNRLQPARNTTSALEQRGCLHANMDLYKWAFKLAPFTPAELTADCFELAAAIREVDMRASPYDLRGLGFEPIAIETPAGRAEYERHQRGFAARGEPLRARLVTLCDRLLAATSGKNAVAGDDRTGSPTPAPA